MRINWTSKAQSDLLRLYEFLLPVNRLTADQALQSLQSAPARLLMDHPRIAQQIETDDPRKVRRLFVGDYELRYEVRGKDIIILRLWHTREDR
jgi:plasmid stabilization system protein ParE